MRKTILLVIDGFGVRKEKKFNAVADARKPNYDLLVKKYPHTILKASGKYVGLPKGSQGNSEVGHLHLGAGRVVWQPLQRINNSIKGKSFYKNAVLEKLAENARKNNSLVHLTGLCSDGNVHSSIEHLKALMEFFSRKKLGKKVRVHFIADGRDVPTKSAPKYVKLIEKWRKKYGGRIATVCGRFYAMDRDKNWGRSEKYYNLLTEGIGAAAESAVEGIEGAYSAGIESDYYLPPIQVGEKCTINDSDSVLAFNYRTDRARQITKAFMLKDFSEFKRAATPKVFFATFTEYDKAVKCPSIFPDVKVGGSLGEIISRKGLKQLRVAETEKYAHVTYFFNSQVEKPFKGEERILVPSSKVESYDMKPEMSADGITENTVREILKGKYSFMLINFANPDLVGHSANHAAIVKAVEKVDECLGKIYSAAMEEKYVLLVTSDHGNAEETAYPDGTPKASHTANPVPFILAADFPELAKAKLWKGSLIDVAPTILKIMGLKKPKEMIGKPLY